MAKEVGFTSCSSLSDSSDANTPKSHCSRGSGGQAKRSSQAGWTDEEDAMLTQQVKKYSGKNWKKIAELIPGRSDTQCLHRWQKVLNPDLVKGPWTKEEDDCIRELVGNHGCKKWSFIAKHLTGRIGKQCRERWYNHLDPAIKKDAWTDDEECTLAYYHQIYGNKWAEIARFLPGRTDNAIKNHWNGTRRSLDLNMSPADVSIPKKKKRRISLMEQNTSGKLDSTQSNTCLTNLTLGNSNYSATDDDRLGFTRYTKACKVEPSTSQVFNPWTSPDGSFLSLGTPSYGSVCCQPPKLKNLTSLLENGGCGSASAHQSAFNSCSQSIEQISCSSPPDLTLTLSINRTSSTSVLRNCGLSYKNTPSIIRKRTPSKTVDCVASGEVEAQNYGSESWLHRYQISSGRRLDYMFNEEWDQTMFGCRTPGSVTSSSKPNAMLTP